MKAMAAVAEAQNAVQNLLAGYGLAGRDALAVLRRVGEDIARGTTDTAGAFEQVRLQSLGVEAEMLAEEGGMLSDAEFARQLGIKSRQTVHNYRQAGKLIAVPRGVRNVAYPAWQIHRGALLPGLAEVLAALRPQRLSPLARVNFFLTEAGALDDQRPLDALRAGEVAAVVAHAQRYGVIGS